MLDLFRKLRPRQLGVFYVGVRVGQINRWELGAT